MKWEPTDLALGLLVLVSVALLGYTTVWSLGEGAEESAYALDAIFDDATGIAPQAPVELQGYRVGSVRAVQPFHTPDGALHFRVRLDLGRRLGDGAPLRLPEGTRAELTYRGLPIGAGIVALVLPAAPGEPLPQGAEIPGAHAPTAVDLVQTATEQLTGELQATLLTTRTLMDTLTHTAATADATVQGLRAELTPVLGGLQRQLVAAEALTREAQAQLAAVAPAATAGIDSVTILLGDVNRLVRRLDGVLAENEPRLADIVANLDTTSIVMEHLAREFSRRPLRTLFSGSGELPLPPTAPAPGAEPGGSRP